ncbi:hypothetical protein M0R36_07545 [bacterium]|jgi:hypothetical protein|nr:hypothetical protein [bacterium]
MTSDKHQRILFAGNIVVLLVILVLFGYLAWGKFYSEEALFKNRVTGIKKALESKNIGFVEKMLSDEYRDDLEFDKTMAVNYISSIFKDAADVRIFIGDIKCIFEGEKAFAEIKAEYRIKTKDYLFTNVLSANPGKNTLKVVFNDEDGLWLVSEVKNFREFFGIEKAQVRNYFR